MTCEFNCARTCRTEEPVDVCRFLPLLEALGAMGPVTSHTTTVKVSIKSKTALADAVRGLGGEVLGEGTHTLYDRNVETGYAVRLPGWRAPVVLRADGTLAFDQYGNENGALTIPQMTGAYVLCAARETARQLGWSITAQSADSVTIRHRTGGTLTVRTDGTCEAAGFVGAGCHVTRPIEEALGAIAQKRFKPEYHAQTGTRITGTR